ncbi:MAG: hypothetical protein ACJA2U_001997 [Marinomonas primoryensis]|jgi:hypothetical protein
MIKQLESQIALDLVGHLVDLTLSELDNVFLCGQSLKSNKSLCLISKIQKVIDKNLIYRQVNKSLKRSILKIYQSQVTLT